MPTCPDPNLDGCENGRRRRSVGCPPACQSARLLCSADVVNKIGKIKIACDHGRKADKDQGRALLHLKSRFIIRHLSLSFVSKATTSAARAITVCNRRRVCSQSLIIGLPLTAAAGVACLCLSQTQCDHLYSSLPPRVNHCALK